MSPDPAPESPEASCCVGFATNGHESCTCPGGEAYRPPLEVVLGSVSARVEELGHVEVTEESHLGNVADGLARALKATRPGSSRADARTELLELTARVLAWERSL